MALDATKPKDTDLVSQLAAYHRETRLYINNLESLINALSGGAIYMNYNCSPGQTVLTVGGVGLGDVPIESVFITGTGGAGIVTISGARTGQIKIFRMGDANVTFADTDNIVLNQPAHASPYGGTVGDVLALVNHGGDPGTLTDGVWHELWRTPLAT